MADSFLPGPARSHRRWLFFFAFFSILVGGFAIARPLVMTVAIEQVLGIVLLMSGVFSIVAVVFGDEKRHRIATVVLAFIRLAAGLAFLVCVKPGVVAITVLLGVFFVAEGLTFLVSSLALRPNRAWLLIFLNGLVALVLAGLIFAQIPSGDPGVVGLLYGINSVFYGLSLLAFAREPRSPG